MENKAAMNERIPVLESYLNKASAHELARRSLLGAPVYTVISLIMLAGTPMLMDYGWWSLGEIVLLIILGGIRVRFALSFESRYEELGEKAVLHFSILTALQSLTLGFLAAMVLWQYWAAQEVILTIVLSAGCVAAGTSALSVRRSAHIIFLACVLVPFGVSVFVVGGLAKALLIVGFLALMAFLVQDGGQARQAYFKNLKDGYNEMISSRRQAIESHARSEFMRDIGHEIRTPVNSIIGMAALLLDENLGSKAQDFAAAIRENSVQLLKLVGNMPGGIKTDLHISTTDPGALNLRESSGDVLKLYAAEASRKDLELTSQLEGLPEDLLSTDATQLEQVLANLLANAIAFTEKGTVTLSAFCESLKDGTMFVEFSVADTGTGITDEILESIFDPFDPTGAKSSGKFGGSGLGLPLCKGLVDLMGGDIWIESEQGVGTTVKFYLRIDLDPSLVTSTTRKNDGALPFSDEPECLDISKKFPHKILVVDDDDIHRQIMCIQLKKFGYDADEVVDGEQAIAAVMSGTYDLIFMDLRMPNMSGIESSLWIRERFNGKHAVRIIALTGDATQEARQQSIRAGMDSFVTKPAKSEDIKAILTFSGYDAPSVLRSVS